MVQRDLRGAFNLSFTMVQKGLRPHSHINHTALRCDTISNIFDHPHIDHTAQQKTKCNIMKTHKMGFHRGV